MLDSNIGWYNLYETAAFTLIKFGNQTSQKNGRQIIRDLFNGKTPGSEFDAPPVEWLKWIQEAYFPVSTDPSSGRLDPLSIGTGTVRFV